LLSPHPVPTVDHSALVRLADGITQLPGGAV